MGTTGQSITLANSIIGVGILAMPFCFQQCGVILATLILLVMGLISRLCCYFLLKSALLARRRNFEFLAFHVFGPAGKLAVEVGIIGFLMGTCIAYFVVVGDLGPQIVAKMFNINQSDILRTSIMVLVSLVCVLPLGLLRNVDSLSNVSAATIAFYFCLVMKVITEAASQLMTSDWHSRMETWRPAGVLQCVPIFSMALFCQTQLFEIFESLPTLSLEKMNVVTKNAINICTCVYFTLGVFGYIAFSSQNISGNILMSLSPTMASDVIKLGFVMSLAFSFPLIIFPCRASLYSFLYKKVHSSHHDHIINNSIPETTFRCITIAIIAVALFISLLIPNIELVLGLVGSTIGVLICVVFPAACFVNVTFKNTNERILAKGVLILGLVIMVLGTYANLQAAENKRVDRYEEKYTQERIDKMVEDFFEKRGNKDVYQEPVKSDSISKEPYKSKLNGIEIIKDSEVQPPNPVPPESKSNENVPELKEESLKIVDKKPKADVKESLGKADKALDTHPKDVKTRIDEKLGNGDSKQEIKINGAAKQRGDDKLTNGEIKADPQKAKETKPSNEDKLDILKQQKLIETIKQHGEEQKELIKEQKEILDEIIKTKKELEQNKNEVDPNEAKKIAVESIKQIANMAIQSLGGVTDKPLQQNDEKAEKLEKLTNDAVQEIAKKAVETIEAIKDIKNPEPQPVPSRNIVQNKPNIQTNGAINNVPVQNIQPNMNMQPQPQDVQNNPQNPNIPIQNGQPNNIQQAQAPINQNNLAQEAVKPQINDKANIPSQKILSPNVETNNIPNKLNLKQAQNFNNQPLQNKINQVNKVEHDRKVLPNAVKSQQQLNQGENAQANVPDKIAQKVPLPIAVNNMLNNQPKIDKNPLPIKQNEVNIKNKNENINNDENINGIHRQKREVVDCTQKVTLKPEDKEICDTLVNTDKNSEEILPNVDLNDVGLRKDLPLLDPNEHYIRRSLQSINKDES